MKTKDKIGSPGQELFIDYQKTGNQRSFNNFVNETNPWLLNMIRKYVSNQDAANDIAQEVWIIVEEKKHSYDVEKASVRTWIFSYIARGRILHYLRDSKKEISRHGQSQTIIIDGEEVDIFDSMESDASEMPDYDAIEQNKMIIDSIKKLDDKFQDVVLLHHYGNLKLKDVALLTSNKHNTVRIWHDRAKKKLEKFLHNFIMS